MTIFDISLIIIAGGLIGTGFIGVTKNPISRYLLRDVEKELV